MKCFPIITAIAIIFSSCLKESIPDAMVNAKQSATGGASASLSYEVNGKPVFLTVPFAGNQDPNAYTLGCSKSPGYYSFYGLSATGELTFSFYTDSLTNMKYTYPAGYGDMYFMNYNGEDEFVHGPTDNLSFTITSYSKGRISGTFSGQLTPLVTASTINNIYGPFGSTLVTNGSFQNVPVFY